MISLKYIICLAMSYLALIQSVQAGSIFDGTPFQGVANAACNATGTCNLQQKAGLPNIGGDLGNFFEQAKKNSGPLVTTITTLNCPGCVIAAGVISGPGAVQDALFTTGVVTAAYEVSPALGFIAVVILAADKDSGEVGYEQVTVAENRTVHLAKPKIYTLSANCIAQDGNHIFALFLKKPDFADQIKDGDTVKLTSPVCKQIVSKGAKSLTVVTMKKAGGNPINMSDGHFKYLLSGRAIGIAKIASN